LQGEPTPEISLENLKSALKAWNQVLKPEISFESLESGLKAWNQL
jgi:hypothetical protein